MNATRSRPERLSSALGVAILAIGCGVGMTTTAWAQDGAIVGGSLTVLGNPFQTVPDWTVVGNGFSVLGFGADVGGEAICTPCAPGKMVNIGGLFGGSTLGSGKAVVNGVLYGQVYFAGALLFGSNGAVMPDLDGNSWRNVTVPFHLGPGSDLVGYGDSARTQLLFTIRPLVGTGTVTLHLLQSAGLYNFESVTYTFGPAIINLLQKPGFEEYTPPALGLPGWVSDTPFRETDAPCLQCAGGVGAAFGVRASVGKLVVSYLCNGCGHLWDIVGQ